MGSPTMNQPCDWLPSTIAFPRIRPSGPEGPFRARRGPSRSERALRVREGAFGPGRAVRARRAKSWKTQWCSVALR